EIDKAEKRAHEIRCRSLGYQYPLAQGETAAANSATALFTLVDADGNPDPGIARAKSHLDGALAAVLAAELDRCDQERAAGSSEATEAYALVDAVLAAKVFVERQVPEVRANLGRLTGELDPAATAVAELKSDFLAANYTGEPEKLDQARRQVEATPARLAAIKTAYDEQRFLACRASVEKLGGNVQSSRDRLTEVHSRLATLRQLRQHARDVTTATRSNANTLATKLQTNAFTTSAATDGEFQRFNSALTAQ